MTAALESSEPTR
uniref:Uncharacterized protein n=1 Tax=Arundo donax TaxID=35708 RepID=A0A0A9EGY4_ARUDO